MRAIAIVALLAWVPACHLVFSLDETVPAACRHSGIELCLTFDDLDELGADHSGRNLDATMSGVAQIDRTFPINTSEKALDIQQDAVIAIEGNNLFDYPGPMSIDFWLQHQEHPTDAQFVLDNSGQYGFKIRPLDGGGTAVVDCYFGIDVPGDPNGRFNQAFTRAEPGRWNHFACVATPGVDGEQGEAVVYLNGDRQPMIMTLFAGETIHTGQNQFLRLGFPAIVPEVNPDKMVPPTTPFVGQLDNMRLWARALDPETEIKLFAQGIETGN